MELRYATQCLVALNRQIAELTEELTELRQQLAPGRTRTEAGQEAAAQILAAQAILRQARRKRNRLLADPHFPGVAETPAWRPAAGYAFGWERAAVR